MKEVEIFLEGTSDWIFLADYLEIVLGFTITIPNRANKKQKELLYQFSNQHVSGTIQLVGYYTDFATPNGLFQQRLAYNKVNDITTLILVDADIPDNGGGFSVREQWLNNVPNRTDFEGFIMPNNRADGYLEILLRTIITEEYQSVAACIEQQNDCLLAAQNQLPNGWLLSIPPQVADADKERMNYFKSVANSKKNYKNTNIWNLNHPYLNPLKSFLQTHLQQA